MSDQLEFVAVRSPAEIAATARLAAEIWREFYIPLIGNAQVDYMVDKFQSEAAIQDQIAAGYEYFQVRRAGEPIGYWAVQTHAEERTLFISKFYVRRDRRGTGTGRACMEFIEQLARRRGLGSLWLTVNKRNPSVGAYERLGFRIAAEVVMDIGNGFVMDDFRMEKTISSSPSARAAPS